MDKSPILRQVHSRNRELNAQISGICSHSCNKGEVAAKSRGPSLKTALKRNRNKPQQDFSQLILSLPWQQIVLRPHCCTDLKPRLPESQTEKYIGSDMETSAAFIYLSSVGTS